MPQTVLPLPIEDIADISDPISLFGGACGPAPLDISTIDIVIAIITQ
ncbi:hypothetical protein [Sphingobium algorifonticola]|nr:hypothetical protein [Sphingobium algorifonticola]